MSHNYPYRRPPSDTDLRPEAGPYGSADRHHSSADRDFYRPPQESSSSSYPPSSSSRGLTSAQWSQDGALSILSSCGLEPSDLALLAELPEDVLTVESLPHVLKQLKGKRGTIRPFPPSNLSPSSSSSSSSYRRPPVSSSGDWDRLCSQPIQYPLDHVTRSSFLSEQDRWGNPRTSSSVRADPSSSSSTSRYTVDFHHRSGPPEYGKTSRTAHPVSSQDQPSFSLAEQGKRTRPAGSSETRTADYRSAPPPEDYHPKPQGDRRESQTSSTRSSSRHTAATPMPSEKEALDFHGTCPKVFPYSCSLCDITVLSEKVWIKHINGTQHAEGQLSLLQQFPSWDCRLQTVSRANKQSEKRKDEEKTSHPSQTANQNHKPQPNIKREKKTAEKGKVVCVKFPPQSVDEAYLRKLTEPFGKIVKILMFPSLAFVELGSVDQAKDLVKFHVNYPPTVNGEQIKFSISNTFNFLQSSQVVSFTPVPAGEDGQSDLISIVKRFGPPLYSLFLPSMAFVEMKNAPDAQKLVDYYSSNTLRINNERIRVSFSGEYKTLMRVPSANRYDEENVLTKRTRSSSREKGDEKTESKRRRSSSKERRTSSSEGRSTSRDKSSTVKRTRTRSRSRDKSKEKSSGERKTRSKSREKSNKDSKTRSRSRDKSSSRSRENTVETEKPETEPRTTDELAPLKEAAESQESEEKAELSAGESDIEGMEVIGEDGENVEEEDMETLDNAEGEEDAEGSSQAQTTQSPEEDKEEVMGGNKEVEACEVKKPEEESEANRETEEAAETQLEDDEEPDFPVDLENCITLDELEEDQSDDQGKDVRDEAESPSSRVVYFKDLPTSFYTDAEFIQLVKDFGRAERYLLIRRRYEGFIEMSSSSEAQRAAEELSRKSVTLNGSNLNVCISHKYQRLSNGYEIPSCSDKGKRSESHSSSRSERQSKSNTSDRDETCRESEGKKESSKKTLEEESGSKKSTERTLGKESSNKKTEKSLKNSDSRKTPEKESGSKESASKKSGHKESSDQKTQEKDVKDVSEKEPDVRKTLDKESGSKTAHHKDSSDKETDEKDIKNMVGKGSDARRTPEEESVCKKSPEKELTDKTTSRTPDRESADKKTSEEDTVSEKAPEVESLKKTQEKDLRNTSQTSPRRTPDKESEKEPVSKNTEENNAAEDLAAKTSPEKELPPEKGQENKRLKRKESPENDSVPEKTLKKESDSEKTERMETERKKPEKESAEKTLETEECEEKSSKGQVCCEQPAVQSPDPPDPQTEQEADIEEQLQDSVQVEQGPGPAGDTAEPEKPTKPVGAEFVRPVVGYFCNLCQLIYADEDEAKLQHCSSLMHYRKYQEKTGKDPWSS